MATGQNIIDRVRDILQDTTDLSFSDAQLLRYINRGATEFCTTTNCLHDTGTIDTDSTNFSFNLDNNLTNPTVVISAEYNGTPLDKSYRYEIRDKWGASVGTPTRWYQYGAKIYTDLIPTTATGSSALTLFYLRVPSALSATTDTLDLPLEWEPAVVYFTVAECYKTQRDSVLAAENLAKYEGMRQDAYNLNKFVLLGDKE